MWAYNSCYTPTLYFNIDKFSTYQILPLHIYLLDNPMPTTMNKFYKYKNKLSAAKGLEVVTANEKEIGQINSLLSAFAHTWQLWDSFRMKILRPVPSPDWQLCICL